jgi:hypothetical protein
MDCPLLIHAENWLYFKDTQAVSSCSSQHRASRPEARHQTQTWESSIQFQPSQLSPYFPDLP